MNESGGSITERMAEFISADGKRFFPTAKICRLCTDTDGPFLNMYGGNMNMAEKIKRFIPIELDECDDLPHKVCYMCSAKVTEISQFIQKCVSIEEMFCRKIGKVFMDGIVCNSNVDAARQNDTHNRESVASLNTETRRASTKDVLTVTRCQPKLDLKELNIVMTRIEQNGNSVVNSDDTLDISSKHNSKHDSVENSNENCKKNSNQSPENGSNESYKQNSNCTLSSDRNDKTAYSCDTVDEFSNYSGVKVDGIGYVCVCNNCGIVLLVKDMKLHKCLKKTHDNDPIQRAKHTSAVSNKINNTNKQCIIERIHVEKKPFEPVPIVDTCVRDSVSKTNSNDKCLKRAYSDCLYPCLTHDELTSHFKILKQNLDSLFLQGEIGNKLIFDFEAT